jgi:Fe-S-cluster containining protein
MEAGEIKRIFYRDGFRLALEHLGHELTAAGLDRAITQLYQSIDELLESFLQRSAAEGQLADCKKGCAWCCHQEVFAVTHEFLFLNDYVKRNFSGAVREKILEQARKKVMRSMHLSVEEQLQIRVRCPFLDSGACLVYEARPMACRIYLSTSEPSCKKEHDGPGSKGVFPDLFEFPLLAGRMLNEGFVAGLKQLGLQSAELPLEQGYSTMVTMGQTMEDWISNV